MKEFIDFVIGCALLLALAYGVVHVVSSVTRRVVQLARIVASRGKGRPSEPAKPAASA